MTDDRFLTIDFCWPILLADEIGQLYCSSDISFTSHAPTTCDKCPTMAKSSRALRGGGAHSRLIMWELFCNSRISQFIPVSKTGPQFQLQHVLEIVCSPARTHSERTQLPKYTSSWILG